MNNWFMRRIFYAANPFFVGKHYVNASPEKKGYAMKKTLSIILLSVSMLLSSCDLNTVDTSIENPHVENDKNPSDIIYVDAPTDCLMGYTPDEIKISGSLNMCLYDGVLYTDIWVGEQNMIMYCDESSNRFKPLCNKEGCLHADITCNAALGGDYVKGFTVWQNRIYWIEQTTYLSGSDYLNLLTLCCQNLDGTQRARIKEFENISSGTTFYYYDGYAYYFANGGIFASDLNSEKTIEIVAENTNDEVGFYYSFDYSGGVMSFTVDTYNNQDQEVFSSVTYSYTPETKELTTKENQYESATLDFNTEDELYDNGDYNYFGFASEYTVKSYPDGKEGYQLVAKDSSGNTVFDIYIGELGNLMMYNDAGIFPESLMHIACDGKYIYYNFEYTEPIINIGGKSYKTLNTQIMAIDIETAEITVLYTDQ